MQSNSAIGQAALSAKPAAVDICVLGGGAVGTAAVLLALQQGLSVLHLVTEPPAQLHNAVPRSFAIAPQVQAGLARLGVWGLLTQQQVQRCTDMRVFWEHGGLSTRPPSLLHLSAAQAGQAQLCSFVSESDVLAALKGAASQAQGQCVTVCTSPSNQPVLAPCQNSQGGAGGMNITLAGHASWRAQLCVIAQGAGSPAAQQLALEPTVFDYQHSAVVAVLGCDWPSSEAQNHTTAWQWLGSDAQGADVLALLPLPALLNGSSDSSERNIGCTRFGLVWSQPSAAAQAWVGRDAQLLAAVQARVGAAVGHLSLHSAVQQFPLFKSTAPFTAQHTAVVGDAAHKIHPLAGQGLNLGFEDVFALFDTLAQREPWRSLGDARLLARYQRRRTAQSGAVGSVVHAIATRSQWPLAFKHFICAALQTQHAWPVLSAPLRCALVNAATRGSV